MTPNFVKIFEKMLKSIHLFSKILQKRYIELPMLEVEDLASLKKGITIMKIFQKIKKKSPKNKNIKTVRKTCSALNVLGFHAGHL